jgi:hypothetical protein
MEAEQIFTKYVEKIKEINSCGADVVMDSVWTRVLADFYVELETEMKRLKKLEILNQV